MSSRFNDDIQRLSAERQRLWKEGGDVSRVTKSLTEAYAARRTERARDQHGDPGTIIKRARIESELERLMSSD